MAKKVPKIKTTGDVTRDTMKTIERGALVTIIDCLVKHGDWMLPMHGIMNSQELDKMKQEQVKDNDVDEWKGNYDTFKQLPESWKQNSMCKSSGIPTVVMAKVAEKDAAMVDVLFEYDMQMKMGTKFPEDCHDVAVCSKTCTKRSQDKGRRLMVAWNSSLITREGLVDYGKLCFQPKMNDAGLVLEILHISGMKAKVPPHMPMSKEFVMCDNHLDMEAKMVLQTSGALLDVLCVSMC